MPETPTRSVPLPHGGVFNYAPAVCGVFYHHVAAICADPGSREEADAIERRDHMLRVMNDEQRGHAHVVAVAIQKMLARKPGTGPIR